MEGCRRTLFILTFLAYVIFYLLRVNLSVAIVGMVAETKRDETIVIKDSCPFPDDHTFKQNQTRFVKSEFLWDEGLQGRILGSFFIGYLCTNFIGGRLAESYGGKVVAGNGIVLTAILTLFLPYAAYYSVHLLIFLRFLQGVTEGVVFPSFNALAANWIPPKEKGLFLAMMALGSHSGSLVAMAIGGIIVESEGGWPWIFYYSGGIGLIWGIFWYFFIFDSPTHHPWIGKQEKNYLLNIIEKPAIIRSYKVPYSKIFMSIPFYTIILAHMSNNWGWYLLLTELPTYFSTVHHLDVKQNGFLSAIPYVGSLIFGLIYAVSSYKMIGGSSAIKRLRRRSTVLSHFVPMICLLLVPYAGCQMWIAAILITVAMMGISASPSGFLCGYQELSPNFAGTISGIGNTFATTPGFIAPSIAGAIINSEPSIASWQKVFELTAIFYFFSGLFYLRYMSIEVQAWNNCNNSAQLNKMMEESKRERERSLRV